MASQDLLREKIYYMPGKMLSGVEGGGDQGHLPSKSDIGVYLFSVLLFTCLVAETKINKKVLLRECKRHTARRVVSTPSVVLPGYPPGGYPGGGTWTPPGGYLTGYPPGGVPGPPGGVPDRVPPRGVPGPPLPPPGVDRQTKWNYYLPVVLRTRAVIRMQNVMTRFCLV